MKAKVRVSNHIHTNRNNFGSWILLKLNSIDKSQSWLRDKLDISGGAIHRWLSGSFPRMDMYLLTCKIFAAHENRPLDDIIKDSLDYMPYLVSYQRHPLNCPTCGQRRKHESIKSIL